MLYSARRNGKFGLIDVTGNVIIDFEFEWDEVVSWEDSFACVLRGDTAELYDFEGNQTGQLKDVEEISTPSEGILVFKRNGLYGAADEHGHVVVPPSIQTLTHFSNARALFLENGKCGVIGVDGQRMIEPRFSAIQHWKANAILTGAQLPGSDRWVLIDGSGEVVGEEFDWVGSGGEKATPVRFLSNSLIGLVDQNGRTIVEGKYAESNHFASRDSIATEKKKGGKWGIIDLKGDTLLNPTFSFIGEEASGLRRVKFGGTIPIRDVYTGPPTGKWGFVDSSGKEVIKCRFDSVSDFNGGLAHARLGPPGPDSEKLLINQRGETVFRNS